MRRIRAYFTLPKVADLMASAIFLVALARLLSYLTGEHDPQPWFGLGQPMAVSTAVCLILASLCPYILAHIERYR